MRFALFTLYYTSIVNAHTDAQTGQPRVLPLSDSGVALRDGSRQLRETCRCDAHSPIANAPAKTT